MNEINWGQVVVSLISGGAAGAILTGILSAVRARRQPVGYRIEPEPVFGPLHEDSSLSAKVTISKGGADFSFSNLFIVRLEVVNKGNQDHESFQFGLTLADGDAAIFVEPQEPDRHHRIKILNPVGPANPKSQLDFTLNPFNRRDLYTFNIFAVGEARDALGEIEIGSGQPVRFVSMPSVAELIAQPTEGLYVDLGPIRLSFGPRRRKP